MIKENPEYYQITQELLEVARKSGEVILSLKNSKIRKSYKDDGDLVTQADHASHDIFLQQLNQRFPNIPLILEEQDNPKFLPPSYIAADELDGTVIFANGMAEWGVTLAYIEKGSPVAGVLHQPELKRTIISWYGGGTWYDNEQLTLDNRLTLNNTIVLVEFNRHLTIDEVLWIKSISTKTMAIRCIATAVGSAIEMLLGKNGVYLNCRGGKVWDFAAASLAIQEAGGVALRHEGEALEWTHVPMGVLFATSSLLAQEVFKLGKHCNAI